MTDQVVPKGQRARTLLVVPVSTTAYWNDWARLVSGPDSAGEIIIETTRRGDDGRSDAQYIVDRLASGLYTGRIV